MKNNLFASFTAALLVCINNASHTQGPASIPRLNSKPSPEQFIPASRQFRPVNDSEFIFRNDINIKAVRNFIKHFGEIPGVTWLQSGEGPGAYFTRNGIKTKVFYYKNGDYEKMLQYYYEDKLPRDIRHLVKSRYYDFSICCIIEVNTNGKTIYDVKIEDKTSWKTIRVADDEMKILVEYSKQNIDSPSPALVSVRNKMNARVRVSTHPNKSK